MAEVTELSLANWYRRGHGFESRSSLNFFHALISKLLIKLCVYITAKINHVFISFSALQFKYMIFHIVICILHLLQVNYKLTM